MNLRIPKFNPAGLIPQSETTRIWSSGIVKMTSRNPMKSWPGKIRHKRLYLLISDDSDKTTLLEHTTHDSECLSGYLLASIILVRNGHAFSTFQDEAEAAMGGYQLG
jgi:hypothetical protein